MIKTMRLRKDKTAKTGKLFKINYGVDVYKTSCEKFGVEETISNLLYGNNVFLQKDIGESGEEIGRDWTLVNAYLMNSGIDYTVEDYAVGEKVEDEYTALKKEYTIEEIKEALALRKASKG